MFSQYYFAQPLLHNILYHIIDLEFYRFTCLRILEGDIIGRTNYDYDKYFSIAAGGKSGG